MNLPPYLKNKAILFGLGTVVIVILLAVATAGESPQLGDTSSPSPAPATKTTSSFKFTNLSDDKIAQGTEYRNEIVNKLPVFVEEYKTSTGITTTINIYVNDKDSKEIVRFEIYGLTYQDPNPKGKEATAYAESFREGSQLLRSKGIDPTKIIFQYGTETYVVQSIAKWISSFNLSP